MSPTKKKMAIDDYHRLEIEQIYNRLREHGNRRTQVYSFLGTAHLVSLGLAFTNQRISIMILAIIFLIALLTLDRNLRKPRVAAELRGLELESLYAPDPEFAFLHIWFAASHSSTKYVEDLMAINKIEDPRRRVTELKRIRPGLTEYVVVFIVIIVEVVLAFSFWLSGWKIF